jgi:hypothetical protein
MARWEEITKDVALREIRKYREQYPESPPEVAAIGLDAPPRLVGGAPGNPQSPR